MTLICITIKEEQELRCKELVMRKRIKKRGKALLQRKAATKCVRSCLLNRQNQFYPLGKVKATKEVKICDRTTDGLKEERERPVRERLQYSHTGD